jgi:phenylalanyl-tRNA synthetase beta chain
MKFLLSWLEDHAPLDADAGRLAEDLLRLGFEVVEVKTLGASFQSVVAAKVVSVEKHPNADRLSVCSVQDGGSVLAVVCGAPNVKAGQTVALARVGAVLPGGRAIARARIRGVESQGMICSAPELGLPEDPQDGILVLESALEPGTDLSGKLGSPPDAVLDVDVTPNRPDCLSHRGLAREIAALRGLTLKPAPDLPRLPESSPAFPVFLDAPEACPAYLGLLIDGVSAKPSPAWLSRRLSALGAKATNVLVDASNYVLWDVGQPLHAFDADRIAGGEIHVRWAREGESVAALDGKDYALNPSCLVIADKSAPAAIAGVMGGGKSAVSERTTRVFLESASFLPRAIRKASRFLRLGSESSYRFERGVDPGGLRESALRAVRIILDACRPSGKAGGAPPRIAGATFAGKEATAPPAVRFSLSRLNAVLGADIPADKMEPLLKTVAASFSRSGDAFTLAPPTWRPDLAEICDVAEEVARFYGFDRIPSRLHRFTPGPAAIPPAQEARRALRSRLSNLGFFEAYHYDFLSRASLDRAGYPADRRFPRLVNPVSDEWEHLRPTLLIGLLEAARRNANRGAPFLRLFEIGEAYETGPDGKPRGRERLAGIVMGSMPPRYWDKSRTRAPDFFDLKGIVEDVTPGIPEGRWRDAAPAGFAEGIFYHAGAARFLAGEGASRVLGAYGIARPAVARAFDLEPGGVLLFEVDLEPLTPGARRRAGRRFKAPSPFQGSWRDLSILIPASVRWADVSGALGDAGARELSSWELADEFAGRGIPEGLRSLTLRLYFGAPDRTLTDVEVSAAVSKILGRLTRGLGAKLRE